ncbi:MAG: glucosamine-6-phosphate isomerase, partial [Draconibacterium sp.]
MKINFTKVEEAFYKEAILKDITTKIPYLTVESFPKLGLLSALSFIEWVNENPEGVVSLPTGKTAQYFIRFLHLILDNWDTKKGVDLLEKYNLKGMKKPDFSQLHFVQMGEFYPINSSQHNSLYNFAVTNYIEGFGFDKSKALLMNSEDIKLAEEKSFSEIFPDYIIDLTLRFREAKSHIEKLQQESIFKIDNWCTEYENEIREKGGIGFFLSGIGPDGHIAFNTQGTDHFSSTRLTRTNFETQAVVAADLGGIEVSRKRLVITVGLGTINYNPKNKAIIYAAGEAIADTVKLALESEPTVIAPATSLQKLKNGRFYLTDGAT